MGSCLSRSMIGPSCSSSAWTSSKNAAWRSSSMNTMVRLLQSSPLSVGTSGIARMPADAPCRAMSSASRAASSSLLTGKLSLRSITFIAFTPFCKPACFCLQVCFSTLIRGCNHYFTVPTNLSADNIAFMWGKLNQGGRATLLPLPFYYAVSS